MQSWGGAEAAFHARWTVEQLLAASGDPSVCVLDVDLVNCFGSFEWPAIAKAYHSLLPGMRA